MNSSNNLYENIPSDQRINACIRQGLQDMLVQTSAGIVVGGLAGLILSKRSGSGYRKLYTSLGAGVGLGNAWTRTIVIASSHPLAPYAVSLTDATFEHQTQASTGQTTGNWLVQFFQDGELVIPSGDVIISEDDWLESNVVLASVNLQTNPSLKKRFAAHLLDDSTTGAMWIYLHKRGLSKISATNLSWEDLKKFSDSPSTTYPIPPPVKTLDTPNFDPFQLIHQNAGTFGLLCGIVGIRIIVWLVRNYAGENAHRRVIISKRKKRQ